ncbi:MAG TPA: hypothetical protein VGB95_05195 [Chitinophagales bacterium]
MFKKTFFFAVCLYGSQVFSALLFSANAQTPFVDIRPKNADKNAVNISLSGNLSNFNYSTIPTFSKAEHLKISAAAGLNLDSLFIYSAKLSSLKELDITGSYFGALPNSIGLLTQIEILNLSNNSNSPFADMKLRKLPDGIAKLNIRELDLSENDVLDSATIFTQIAKLSKLESLKMQLCELKAIAPILGTTSSIKVLDFSGNSLTTLPAEIGNLVNLQKLDVARNFITILPTTFSNLQQLESLNLEQNKLPDFPLSIASLKKLHYLNLNENILINLPANIGELTELTELRLNNFFFNNFNQKIKTLPASITKLSKLQVLTLQDNVIEQLPENIGSLSNLQHLDLRDNLLSTLPQSFCQLTNLHYLDVKANEMISLPSCLSKLVNLEDLTLAYNPKVQSAYYVEIVKELSHLKFVDISYNGITKEQLQPVMTANPNLKVVNLGFGKKTNVEQVKSTGEEFWNSAPPERKK